MTGELLHVLFGRFLLGLIVLAVIGFLVGTSIKSTGGRITVWITMAIIVIGWITTSQTLQTYDQMARAGLISTNDLDFLFFGTMTGLMSIYSLAQWVGSLGRRSVEQDAMDAVDVLDVHQVLEIAELTFSTPDIAVTPWVQTNWNIMTQADKVEWITSNIEAMKTFFNLHGGLDEFDHAEFVVEMQRLDRKRFDLTIIGEAKA